MLKSYRKVLGEILACAIYAAVLTMLAWAIRIHGGEIHPGAPFVLRDTILAFTFPFAALAVTHLGSAEEWHGGFLAVGAYLGACACAIAWLLATTGIAAPDRPRVALGVGALLAILVAPKDAWTARRLASAFLPIVAGLLLVIAMAVGIFRGWMFPIGIVVVATARYFALPLLNERLKRARLAAHP